MQKKILQTYKDWKNSGYRLDLQGANIVYYGYGWYVVRIDSLTALEAILHHYNANWLTEPQFTDRDLFRKWRSKIALYLVWDLSYVQTDEEFNPRIFNGNHLAEPRGNDLIRIDVVGKGKARIFNRNGEKIYQWPAMRTFSKHLQYFV